MLCVISTIAAVVLSVFIKSNGLNISVGGIDVNIWSVTINRSPVRDTIGMTDVGHRFLSQFTGIHLGTGVMTAMCQLDETTPRPIDINYVINNAATNRH